MDEQAKQERNAREEQQEAERQRSIEDYHRQQACEQERRDEQERQEAMQQEAEFLADQEEERRQAHLHAQREMQEQQRQDLEETLARGPELRAAKIAADARVLGKAQQFDDAILAWKKAISEDPTRVQYRCEFCELLAQVGRAQEALAALQAAMRLHAQNGAGSGNQMLLDTALCLGKDVFNASIKQLALRDEDWSRIRKERYGDCDAEVIQLLRENELAVAQRQAKEEAERMARLQRAEAEAAEKRRNELARRAEEEMESERCARSARIRDVALLFPAIALASAGLGLVVASVMSRASFWETYKSGAILCGAANAIYPVKQKLCANEGEWFKVIVLIPVFFVGGIIAAPIAAIGMLSTSLLQVKTTVGLLRGVLPGISVTCAIACILYFIYSPTPSAAAAPVVIPAQPTVAAVRKPRVIHADSITASTFIANAGGRSASAAQAADDNPKTAWQTSSASAVGQWLEFGFISPTLVEKAAIATGYDAISDKHGDLFPLNAHIRTLSILIDGKVFETKSVGADERRVEVLIRRPVSQLRIRIDDYFKGTRWKNDLCISEVALQQ